MKKVLYILAGIIGLLLLVAAVGGYQVVCEATTPSDNYGRDYDRAYSMVYKRYPEMQAWHDSLVEQGMWRDTSLVNDEGLTLHGIILEHPASDTAAVEGTILLIHGYTDDAPVMMRYAYCDFEMLHQNVILPELQNCGKSEGDHITFGWKDRLDMHHWLDMMHNLWQKPIVVHGLSMGAATTMMLSGDPLPDSLRVSGFVEDCGYSSIWQQLSHQMEVQYGAFCLPFLHVGSLINRLWHGWWFSDGNTLAQVAKCTKPMLFIHGNQDDLVPFQMVHELYNAKQGDKYLWEVPDTKHAKSIHDHWEEYCERVKDFIEKSNNR